MKKINLLLSFVLVLIVLVFINGCHQNKMLEKTQTVLVDDSSLQVNIQRNGNNKYIDNSTSEEYKESYLSALKEDLQACNMQITDDPSKADFSIVPEYLEVKESSVENTVDDAASEYNGMTYVLSNCDVSGRTMIYKGNSAAGVKIDLVNQFANKEEKLTNNRNVGDYIFATNKDNSTYRQKELNEKIFITLCEKCGKRTTAAVSRRLFRYLKKGN